MFLFSSGYIAAAGLSNLQFVNLNASRNMFILGFSFCIGIGVPAWMNDNPEAIQTGIYILGLQCIDKQGTCKNMHSTERHNTYNNK